MDRLPTDFRSALGSPGKMEFLKVERGFDPFSKEEKIDRYVVKKKVAVTGTQQDELIGWLESEVLTGTQQPAKCFDPHDAIRVTQGKDVYDLVICTHCGGTALYKNGKHAGHIRTRTGGKPPEQVVSFLK